MEVKNFDCNGDLISDLSSIKLSEELTESIFQIFLEVFNKNKREGEKNDTIIER